MFADKGMYRRHAATARPARAIAAAAALVAGLAAAPAEAAGEDSAVALIYHRFGEDAYPSTSVRTAQFERHVELLTSEAYSVLPLGEILTRLRNGEALPPRTVAITVDDAYSSVYETAWPILKRHGLPFTLFVATEPVDNGRDGYMSWDQIRELHAAGVAIGSQAVSHPHMPGLPESRARRELTRSAERIAAELGERPAHFAYPYGEASNALKTAAEAAGYSAAFGQHSGAMSRHSDRYYLPRFPINEHYGGMERFRRVVRALPLPVTEVTPDDPFLDAANGGNPPAFGFTLAADVEGADRLACYRSDTGRVEALDHLGPRVELRFDAPFASGRTRINCTLPGPEGRWRWFGMQYYVAP